MRQPKRCKHIPTLDATVTGRYQLTLNSIKRNATQSPLMRLPAELRNQIWQAALGNRVIHLCHRARDHVFSEECEPNPDAEDTWDCNCLSEKAGWKQGVCASQHTELEQFSFWRASTNKKANAEKANPESEQGVTYQDPCQNSCLPKLVDISEKHTTQLEEVDLSILRASRQVYVEANKVLWETNTFAFDNPHDFKLFIGNRNTLQRQLLSKLRIDFYLFHTGPNQWQDVLSMAVIRSLKGLRVVHAHIAYDFNDVMVRWWLRDDECQHSSVSGLLKMMVLPLKIATAMLINNPMRPGSEAVIDGANELKFVESLVSRMVDRSGPEVWKKEWVLKGRYLYQK